MRKRSLCCPPVSVRLSFHLCLSLTLVDCIHTAEDIVKLLVRPGSTITRFFIPCVSTQLQGNPFNGGAKYTGWKNFAILD